MLALQYSPHNKRSVVPCAVLVSNLLLPGSGTLLAACLTEKNSLNFKACGVALLQLVTTLVAVGWFWALWWSVRTIHKSDCYFRDQWYQRKRIYEKYSTPSE